MAPDHRRYMGYSALLEAVTHGHTRGVRHCLKQWHTMDGYTRTGWKPVPQE